MSLNGLTSFFQPGEDFDPELFDQMASQLSSNGQESDNVISENTNFVRNKSTNNMKHKKRREPKKFSEPFPCGIGNCAVSSFISYL